MRTYRKLLTLEALSGVADISVRYLREEIRDGGLLAIRIGLRQIPRHVRGRSRLPQFSGFG